MASDAKPAFGSGSFILRFSRIRRRLPTWRATRFVIAIRDLRQDERDRRIERPCSILIGYYRTDADEVRQATHVHGGGAHDHDAVAHIDDVSAAQLGQACLDHCLHVLH